MAGRYEPTQAGFDLYNGANRALAERGARGEKLTDEEVQLVCAAIIRHAERNDFILKNMDPNHA